MNLQGNLRAIGRATLPATTALLLAAPAAVAEDPYEPIWSRQFGSPATDRASGVAIDSTGAVYVTGTTNGSLGGPGLGSEDAFLAKYDSAGNVLWTRQLGTAAVDRSNAVAVDSAGAAYITGETYGSLGGPLVYETDLILARYDAAGTLLWVRQLGSSDHDYGAAVAVDHTGGAYISGKSGGRPFIARYDASGALLWIHSDYDTRGTSEGVAVAVDSVGDVFMVAHAYLPPYPAEGYSIFVAKHDESGALLWTRELTDSGGAGWRPGPRPTAAAVDSAGDLYITGYTLGDLGGSPVGTYDGFLVKYSNDGDLLWVRRFGTPESDQPQALAVDSADDVYISGFTWGSLGGPHVGVEDVFLAKYDGAGELLWTRQLGTPDSDVGTGIAAAGAGEVYICGGTWGSLGGERLGQEDAFLIKFTSTGCYADCDGNGELDFLDFLCFQNAFAAADPYADCDGNGGFDFFDFLCFQDAFAAGCPE